MPAGLGMRHRRPADHHGRAAHRDLAGRPRHRRPQRQQSPMAGSRMRRAAGRALAAGPGRSLESVIAALAVAGVSALARRAWQTALPAPAPGLPARARGEPLPARKVLPRGNSPPDNPAGSGPGNAHQQACLDNDRAPARRGPVNRRRFCRWRLLSPGIACRNSSGRAGFSPRNPAPGKASGG
jgi:hypothetical protein